MRWIPVSLFVATLALGGNLCAGDECCGKASSLEGKVTSLLKSWEGVSAKLATMCPTEKAHLDSEVATAMKMCPIGSRMGETIAFVRDSLEESLKAHAVVTGSCKSSCGATKTGCDAAKTESCSSGGDCMGIYTKLLGDLHTLASYASGPATGAKACGGEQTTVKASAAQGEFCAKRAEQLTAKVREMSCEKSAASLLVKEVPGLSCERKAAALASSIRSAGCPKEATSILAKAASDCATSCSEKSAVATTTAKSEFCAKKAEQLTAKVREMSCEKSAASLLVKEVPGLSCETKAAALVSSIRSAGCPKEAASVLAKAASECASACANVATSSCATVARFTARAEALKASWKEAEAALVSLSPEHLKGALAKRDALMERCDRTRLLPPTVAALREGVSALHGMNKCFKKTADADPDLVKSMPKELLEAVETQMRLIRQVHEVLEGAGAAMAKAEKGSHKKRAL